jgi:hypothetical protein
VTGEEAARIVTAVRLLWPHSNLGDDARQVVGMWAKMLEGVDYASADAALMELAVGREHAPPVGVLVERAVDRALNLPGWDEVWPDLERLALASVMSDGRKRIPAPGEFSHPFVAGFARERWRMLCPLPDADGVATLRAQTRDAYRAAAGRHARDAALAALGAERRPVLSSSARGELGA